MADRRGQAEGTAPAGGEVLAGLDHLARLLAAPSLERDSVITELLRLLTESLDVGLAFLGQAEGQNLRIERVLDRAGMGLQEGDILPLGDAGRMPHITATLRAIALDPERNGARFASRTVKNDFGVAALSAVPIFRPDGPLFGVLGTLNRQNRAIKSGEVTLLNLASSFIVRVLEESEEAPEAPPALLVPEGPDAILMIDADGAFQAFNAAAARLTGYSERDLIGTNFSRAPVWAPGTTSRVFEELAHTLHGEERSPFSLELVRRDGSTLPIELTLMLMQHNGEALAVEVVMRPAMDTHPTAPTVEEAPPVERGVTLSLPQPVITLDRDGLVTDWNPAAEDLFGWTADDVVGGLIPAVSADEESTLSELLSEVLHSGGKASLETRWRRRDGSPLYIALSAAAIEVDDAVTGVVLVVTDLTERAAAEEALRDSLVRHRQMFEHDATPKLVVDPTDSKIVDANQAACAFYGYPIADFRHLTVADLDIANQDEETTNPSLATLDLDRAIDRVHRLASGETRAVSVQTVSLVVEGRPLLYLTVRDRSDEQRLAEAEVAAAAAMGDLERRRADAETRIADQDQQLAALEVELVQARTEIGELRAHASDAVAEYDQRIATLEEELAASRQALEALHAEAESGQSTQADRIGELEAALERAASQVEEAQALIDRLTDEQSSQMAELELKLADAQRQAEEAHASAEAARAERDMTIGDLSASLQQDLQSEREQREALETEAASLRSLVELSALPIVVLDQAALIRIWNHAAAGTFGWTEADVLGHPLPTVPPDEAPAFDALRVKALSGEHIVSADAHWQKSDGTWIDLSLSLSPTMSTNGEVTGTMAILVDTSDRIRAEAALRDSEARFRNLVAATGDAVILAGLDGTISVANGRAAAFLGFDDSEALSGRNVVEMVSATDRARAIDWLRMAVVNGSAPAEPFELQQPGDAILGARIEARTVADADGEPQMILVTLAAETASAPALEDTIWLLDEYPDAMLLIGADGSIMQANRRAADLYHVAAPDELVGRHAFALISESERPLAMEALAAAAAANAAFDLAVPGTEGSVAYLELRANRWAADDQTEAGFVVTIRDTTQRRLTVEQELRRQAEETESELRASLVRHRQMFEKDAVPRLVVDPANGAIVDANPAACAFYGYSIAELRDRPLLSFSGMEEDVLPALQAGENPSLTQRTAEGDDREVELRSTVLTLEGHELLYVTIHDLTERRAAHEAEAAWESRLDQLQDELSRAQATGAQNTENLIEQITTLEDALRAATERAERAEEAVSGSQEQVERLTQLEEELERAREAAAAAHHALEAAQSTPASTFAELYDPLIAAAPTPLVIADFDGSIALANAAAAELCGAASREAMQGGSMFDLVQPEDRPLLVDVMRKAEDRGTVLSAAFELHQDNGRNRPVELQVGPMSGMGSESAHLVIALREQPKTAGAVHVETVAVRSGRRTEPGIFRLDLRGRVTYANEAAVQMTGYALDDLMGQPLHDIVHRSEDGSPQHNPGQCMLYSAVRDREERHVNEDEFRRRDGSVFPVDFVTTPAREDGRLMGAEVTVTDLEARDSASEPAEVGQGDPFQTLVEKAPVGVCVTNEAGEFQSVNGSFCRLVGFTRDELAGATFTKIMPEPTREAALKVYTRRFTIDDELVDEFEILTSAGQTRTVQSTTMPVTRSDGGRQLAWFVSDVTDRKLQEQQLGDLAHRDQLTGLPNQLLFKDRLKQTVAYAHRRGQLAALLFIDLDDFATLNAQLGHGGGDDVLRQVAGRLAKATRQEDTVSRLGGDRFTVILPDAGSAHNAGVVADKIRASLMASAGEDDAAPPITASIGIAVYPFDARDAEGLLACADAAMHKAKELGKNRFVFHGIEDE